MDRVKALNAAPKGISQTTPLDSLSESKGSHAGFEEMGSDFGGFCWGHTCEQVGGLTTRVWQVKRTHLYLSSNGTYFSDLLTEMPVSS